MSESTHQSHKHIITVHNANGYKICRLCTDTHSHKVLRLNRVNVLVSMNLTSWFQFTNRIQTSNTDNTDFIFTQAAPKPQSSYQFPTRGGRRNGGGGWGVGRRLLPGRRYMFTRTTTLGPPAVLCCYSVSLWSIGHQVNETEDLASRALS